MFSLTPEAEDELGNVPIPIVMLASPRIFNIAVVANIAASLIAGGSADIETPAACEYDSAYVSGTVVEPKV
jgi:hypothetical protein